MPEPTGSTVPHRGILEGWKCTATAQVTDGKHAAEGKYCINCFMSLSLTEEQVETYRRDGCLLLRGFLSSEETRDMVRWVNDMATWCKPTQEQSLSGSHYTFHYESLHVEGEEGGLARVPALCRVENFTPFHGGLDALARERLAPVCAQVLGQPVALFKEKLNIKPAGGKGYAAHYDGPSAAALGLARTFVTAQVAVDAQTVENGCLQVVRPRARWPPGQDMVPPSSSDPDRGGRVGAIPEAVAEELEWEPVECSPGDVLLFDHWMPHRSHFNRSTQERRVLYLLFNPASEGDFRDQYYRLFAQLRAEAAAAAAAAAAVPAAVPAEANAGAAAATSSGSENAAAEASEASDNAQQDLLASFA
jgi:ectoine hydroxylase-related dioxygenase (phytanoyl-CoA dioxygenase family)